jgi:hypothetical protein
LRSRKKNISCLLRVGVRASVRVRVRVKATARVRVRVRVRFRVRVREEYLVPLQVLLELLRVVKEAEAGLLEVDQLLSSKGSAIGGLEVANPSRAGLGWLTRGSGWAPSEPVSTWECRRRQGT